MATARAAMDTAASWRLLLSSASSPPPCPQQPPKRQATFAASPQPSASSSSKFRLLCLLHDKVHSQQSCYLTLIPIDLDRLQLLPSVISDPSCPLVSCLLLEKRVASGAGGSAELAAAEAGNGIAVWRHLGSCTYKLRHSIDLTLTLPVYPAARLDTRVQSNMTSSSRML